MSMDWEAIGAVGEIVGALAVLATLYYLAAQIRIQNRELEKSNQQIRAQMSLDINKTNMEVFDVILRDTEFAEI